MKIFTALSLVLMLGLTACAPKEFSAANEGELALNSLGGVDTDGGEGDVDATGDGDGTDTTSTDPGTPTVPEGTVVVYPAVTMKIPTCTANQDCRVSVVLDRTDSKLVSYEWNTNDSKYLSDPGTYAQPGVHYVATGGVVRFVPGDTEEPMMIRTLSGFTRIQIPFQYRNCKYNDKPIDCSALKIKLVAI